MIFFFLLLSFQGLSAANWEEPWGKDADLVFRPHLPSKTPCETPLLGTIGERLIRFHQEVISPADGPRSHFIPSSSQYTLDAMRKYGFFSGVLYGCDRLMRENSEPWEYDTVVGPDNNLYKWNPVP